MPIRFTINKNSFTIKERGFFTHIDIKNASIPLEEKYQFRVLNVFQEIGPTYNEHIKKGNFNISESLISYKVHGIMKNLDKIKKLLDIFNRVIQSIENNPIME